VTCDGKLRHQKQHWLGTESSNDVHYAPPWLEKVVGGCSGDLLASGKRYTPERIVTLLREAEVLQSKGWTLGVVRLPGQVSRRDTSVSMLADSEKHRAVFRLARGVSADSVAVQTRRARAF
jgi:hypothetical protein